MLVTSNAANKGMMRQLGQQFTWKSVQEGCWNPASSAREQWHPPQGKPWPLWGLHAPWMMQLPRDSSRGNLLTLRCQPQGVLKGSGAQAMPSSILHLAGEWWGKKQEERAEFREVFWLWVSLQATRAAGSGGVHLSQRWSKVAVQCLRPHVLQPHFTMLRCVEQGPSIPLCLDSSMVGPWGATVDKVNRWTLARVFLSCL